LVVEPPEEIQLAVGAKSNLVAGAIVTPWRQIVRRPFDESFAREIIPI
jgi:hypothetical protein